MSLVTPENARLEPQFVELGGGMHALVVPAEARVRLALGFRDPSLPRHAADTEEHPSRYNSWTVEMDICAPLAKARSAPAERGQAACERRWVGSG